MKWLPLVILTLMITSAPARDYGQYADLDPKQKQWFRDQKIPGGTKGETCCSEADGTFAEEDIRDGQYWTRYRPKTWSKNPITNKMTAREGELTAWEPVPPNALLDTPNHNGLAVVWYYYNNGKLTIRCFAPGVKM